MGELIRGANREEGGVMEKIGRCGYRATSARFELRSCRAEPHLADLNRSVESDTEVVFDISVESTLVHNPSISSLFHSEEASSCTWLSVVAVSHCVGFVSNTSERSCFLVTPLC